MDACPHAARPRGAMLAVAAAATAASLVFPVAASAGPQGRTTLTETIRTRVERGFKVPVRAAGESHLVRSGVLGAARPGRAARRRSLAYFAQFTDPQFADEMSPARVEFTDPAGAATSAAWRPQEALIGRVFDQTVRSVNANRTSPVRSGSGGRARMHFAITTGDLADNMQRNETRWFVTTLDGGRVDPFSGAPISARNPCPGADPATVARLNADVAARRYTGVQDHSDYPNAPPDRYDFFYDPDIPQTSGPYRNFPRWPGLMDRAQRPFRAQGLRVPWYTSRGNHDGLVQGNAPADEPLFRSIATGCLKVMPSAGFDPASIRGLPLSQVFARLSNPSFIASLLAGGVTVPPDPERRFVSDREYIALHGRRDHQHGFGFVDPAQRRASRGTAQYYAYTPRPGLRMISLDTVAEGGGANGNLDNPQYQWLRRELDRNSSVERLPNGRLVRDGDPDRLIIAYAHHTLATMDNPTPDEDAGCFNPDEPGCDGDPRNSRPIHLGARGPAPLRDLFFRFPNVIAYVVGHTHHNEVRPYVRPDRRGGFWEINTASHIDWPQQARLIEIMDNRDGTLSLFGTIINHAAPIAIPRPGVPAGRLTDTQLASLARALAVNDPQTLFVTDGGGPGTSRAARNVELLIADPRRLARRPATPPRRTLAGTTGR